ncbi:MAG: ABC transporter ATP-binding protein [Candidatus Thorarchaeota archaeon]
MARALAIEPDVLLLDEPLSNLDAKLRIEMREEIIRIQSEMDITTVYVTHDQHEALSISDRVAVMDQGYVQQFASPRDIYSDPQTIFVADFIGQCTFLDGTIQSVGESITVLLPDGQTISGRTTIEGYPFEKGESVKCAIRPEDLIMERRDSSDNEIAGTVTRTIYIGSGLEVYFEVGGIAAQSLLDPDLQIKAGDTIKMFAPKSEVMVLPIGGVEALRKVPCHPMATSKPPSIASNV